MSQQNKPLCEVLNYLKEKHHISQGAVARELDKKPACAGMTSSKLAQYKTLYIKELPSELIEAMHELYNINPDYLKGTSEVMLDDATIHFNEFKNLVKGWTTITKTPHCDNSISQEKKYLTLTLDSNFYDFLLNVDNVNTLKNNGLLSHTEEFQEYKKEYNEKETQNYNDYLLIPVNSFWKIVSTEKERQKTLSECINLEEHFPYTED